jgi:hypothetical protein
VHKYAHTQHTHFGRSGYRPAVLAVREAAQVDLVLRLPTLVVWLSFGLRGPGIVGQGEAQEGFACARSSGALLARPA